MHSKCMKPDDTSTLSLTGVNGLFLCDPCNDVLSQEEQEKNESKH